MIKIMCKKFKEKKGFTLLEMISVVAVIAIIGAIVTVAVNAYMVSAYMIKANQTAKTVFFATQSYLTQQKEIGALNEFYNKIPDTNKAEFEYSIILEANKNTNGMTAKELETWNVNHDNSVFIYTSVDDESRANSPFYTEILEPNIKDENITKHSFFIEYDKTTGVVMGVFYTEKIKEFAAPYGNDEEALDNVILRDSDSLRSKKQGYYGVNSSNTVNNTVDVSLPEVKLVNSDRLYLEWQDKNIAIEGEEGNPAFAADSTLKDSLYFEVTIKSKNRSEFALKLPDIKVDMNTPSDWKSAENTGDGDSSSPIFIYNKKTNTYSLLLDCVHHSILEKYKGILPTDLIYCEVRPKLNNASTPNEVATSNYESANFGGGQEFTNYNGVVNSPVGGSGEDEDGTDSTDLSFTIKYARHLNNMRNASPSSNFKQTGDIDWKWPELNNDTNNTPMDNNENFSPLVFVDRINNSPIEEAEFKGKYQVGEIVDKNNQKRNYEITGITINVKTGSKAGNVGLFAMIGEEGKIQGLRLLNADVTGNSNVGAVTGTNKGTLSDIQVQAQVTATLLEESVKQQENDEDKTGQNIGGIVGYNSGKLENLTTLLKDVKELGIVRENVVSGTENVGGIVGLNNSSEVKDLINYNNIGIIKEASKNVQNFGGIVGFNDDEIEGSKDNPGKLTNCINKGVILLNNIESLTKEEYPKNIGGIAGLNEGSLIACSSILDDEKLFDDKSEISKGTQTILQDCINGLNIKNGELPSYVGTCVGGIAGVNQGKEATIEDCSVDNAVLGSSIVGGLVGVNMGKVTNNSASTGVTDPTSGTKVDVDGLVIGSGSMVGGIFGYSNSEVTNYSNSANVFGKSMVGGIIGLNGGKFDSIQTLMQVDWNSELTLLSKENESDYKKLTLPDLSDEERGQIEKRFSDYYTLLMSGVLGKNSGDLTDNINSKSLLSKCKNAGFVYASKWYSGGITGVNFGKIEDSNSNYIQDGLINSNYEFITTADCVGGIAGLNKGTIKGNNSDEMSSNIIYGNSFVGGIVGWNVSSVSGYRNISGSVLGRGNYVGGYLGMNSDVGSLDNVDINKKITYSGSTGSSIKGKNYVGGIIGSNVVTIPAGAETTVSITVATLGELAIHGEAYVGGLVGYHSCVDRLDNVPSKCAELTVSNPYGEFNANISYSESEKPKCTSIFSKCENNASVVGNRYVGGIIGCNDNGSNLKVDGSRNSGNLSINPDGNAVAQDTATSDGITGTSYFIGGITGRNTANGIINNCYNNGDVKSPSKYLGGLCEINEGQITNCVIGDVKRFVIQGEKSVGGIVGLNHTTDPNQEATVSNCHANGFASITGGSNTGGLVGTNEALITECTTLANVTAENGDKIGGIVGYNSKNGKISATDVGTSDIRPEVRGKKFVGGLIGTNEGSLLPKVVVVGEEEKISPITNYANVTGENYIGGIVGNNTGKIAGSDVFSGCINYGKINSQILNAEGKIIGSGYAGGITGENAKGKTIENCDNYGSVNSGYSFAGGIVGINAGTIKNCNNLGSVSGSISGANNGNDDAIGGIVGKNDKTGTVVDCVSSLATDNKNSITGSNRVGGLVGWNQGTVKNTSSTNGKNNINITIKVDALTENVEKDPITKKALATSKDATYIGGIIGKDDGAGVGNIIIENYIYSGKIEINVNQHQYIGGITGVVPSKKTIKNCEFRGTITGVGNQEDYYKDYQGKDVLTSSKVGGVGGLAGVNQGTIYLNEVVNKKNHYSSNSLNDSEAVNSVSGTSNVGGIVGLGAGGSSLVYNKTTKDVETDYIINLNSVNGMVNVGGTYGKLERSKNEIVSGFKNAGVVSGGLNVGGVIGQTSGSLSITDCINTASGNIAPNSDKSQNLGGIVGDIGTSVKNITNCYNNGTMSLMDTNTSFSSVINVGGIIGNGGNGSDRVNVSSCYNLGSIRVGTKAVGGIFGNSSGANFDLCDNGEENNSNSGSITTNASNIGGIVGSLTGVATKKDISNNDIFVDDKEKLEQVLDMITNCYNYGTITVTIDTGYMGIGGIVGNTSGNTNYTAISSSHNKGNILVNGLEKLNIMNNTNYGVGGIVGYAFGFMKVQECTNEGNVSAAYLAQVGGIIGALKSQNNNNYIGSISGCKNEPSAVVSGGGDIGGIIGRQEGGEFLTVSGNYNNGKVSGFMNIGGILGRIYKNLPSGTSNAVFTDSTNNGTVEGIAGGAGSIPNIKDPYTKVEKSLGGCIGSADYPGVLFSNLTNNGTVTMSSKDPVIQSSIGGVIGRVSKNCIVENGINKQMVNLNSNEILNGTGTINSVGGIVGSAFDNSQIINCINEKSVIADNVSLLGGIVGTLNGSTLSGCKTEAASQQSDKENPVVQGATDVGGLVGYATGVSTKIMSTVQDDQETGKKQFMGSYNTFNVVALQQKSGKAGGIVGTLSEAAIISVYNTGKVSVEKIDTVSVIGSSNAAGGIVGYSSGNKDSLNNGVIINCYNLGEVGWNDNKPAASKVVSGYIGGIIGYRSYDGGVSDWRDRTCTGAYMRDSYFIQERVQKSLPVIKHGDQVVTPNNWAVGNEPFEQFNKPNDDSQSSKGNKGIWDENAYEALLAVIAQDKDWNTGSGLENELTNVNTILQNYFYKLPIPGTLPVTGVYGTTYEMKWKGLLGLTDGYETALYTETEVDEDGLTVGKGTPIWSATYDKNNVEKLTFDLKSISEKYMGKTIHLSIKAKGYKVGAEPNQVVITEDSDEAIVQSFVMMPPLEPLNEKFPDLEAVQSSSNSQVTLTINGLEKYQNNNPKNDYKTTDLAKLSKGKLDPKELYDSYSNGIGQIKVTDYYTDSKTSGKFEWLKKEWVMKINPDGKSASLTIDYDDPANNLGNRNWHIYVYQICITDEQAMKSLSPDESGKVQYRYLSSNPSEVRFLVSSVRTLTSPINLNSKYNGIETTSVNNPSYTLTWENPQESKEKVGGYRIDLAGTEGGEKVSIEVSSGTKSYVLTADIIKKVMGTSYPEHGDYKLNWSVTALGAVDEDNKITYKDSVPATSDINIPSKKEKVTNINGSITDNRIKCNEVDFTWEDSGFIEGVSTYKVEFSVLGNEIPVTSGISPLSTIVSEKSCKLTLPDELSQKYEITINITSLGELGKSLDSDIAEGKVVTVYPRLPKLETLTPGTPTIDDTDSSNVKVTLNWAIPSGVTSANSNGYLFAILPGNQLDISHAIFYEVPNPLAITTELKFDTTELGKDFLIYAYVLGKEGVSSTSELKALNKIDLPNKRLNKPLEPSVVIQLKNAENIGSEDVNIDTENGVCIAADFDKLYYKFDWKNDARDSGKIKGHRFILKDQENKIINIEEGKSAINIDGQQTSKEFKIDLSEYSGQRLTMSIVNLSVDKDTLASEPTTVEFNVPRIKLTPPQNADVKIQDAAGNSISASITREEFKSLKYVFEWTNGEKDGGKISAHRFILKDEDEDEVIPLSDNQEFLDVSGGITTYTLEGLDLSKYGGKTLDMYITNISTETEALSSAPTKVKITVPSILEDAPIVNEYNTDIQTQLENDTDDSNGALQNSVSDTELNTELNTDMPSIME